MMEFRNSVACMKYDHPDFIVILVAELCGKNISEKKGGGFSQ